MRTCVRMTSHGSAYSQFRRALERGNAQLAWATASELPKVSLEDAIALCLLQLPDDHKRFDRAAVRLHARMCRELRGLGLRESQLIGAALAALPGPGGQGGGGGAGGASRAPLGGRGGAGSGALGGEY